MRKLAFFAPLAATLAVAGAALAQPTAVNITLGPDLERKADELGQREVQEQVDRLADVVQRALANDADLHGATIDLVLTDLKPNRPTMEQLTQRPGLDGIRSVSIGGAAIEGRITMADGSVQPVRYDWYTNTIADVQGYTTWYDANRAYQRLARNLAAGRYETR
jgi:hypothetical protein